MADTKRITSTLEELLQELFGTEDFKDCFLIEIVMPNSQKVEVYVDSDTGINFSQCKQISRYLESHLDEKQWLGEKYTLDVSSPGASRPLQLPRQYHKHIGRTLKVKLKDDIKVKEGTLTIVSDSKIVLESIEITREKKKKIKNIVETEISFDAIESARVVISFK